MLEDKSPVLLLFFNRADTVLQVLDKIRGYRPDKLFLACDGPREGENEKVAMVRRLVLDNVDWPCDIQTRFNEYNLGCGIAVSNAITWFFDQVEQGIILEDDCLPLDGFFDFCDQMLRYYKDDTTVYQIAGTNLQAGTSRGPYSYYFSKFAECWGWATWSRAWKNYDYYMNRLGEFKNEERIRDCFSTADQQNYWIKTFERTIALNTWDYQWLFTMLINNGTCVVPNKNLVLNIGFGGSGTHTLSAPKWYTTLIEGSNEIFPIKYADNMQVSYEADNFRYYQTFHVSLVKKVYRYFKQKFF